MPSNTTKFFQIEIAILEVILISEMLSHMLPRILGIPLLLITSLSLILELSFLKATSLPFFLKRSLVLSQIIVFPFLLFLICQQGLFILNGFFKSPHLFNFGVGYIIYATGIIIWLKETVIKETELWYRVIFIYTFMIWFPVIPNILFSMNLMSIQNSFKAYLDYTSVFFSIIFSGYTMHQWGFNLPRIKLNSKVKIRSLTIAIFPVVIIIVTSFNHAAKLSTFMSSWQFQLPHDSLFKIISIVFIFGSYEGWTFRYVTLWQLLNSKHFTPTGKIWLAALVSSGLFGFSHSLNIIQLDQSMVTTLLQMLLAFLSGLLFSSIALYTGTLWVSIILHSSVNLFDSILGYALQYTGHLSTFQLSEMSFVIIIEALTSIYLLTGQRKQVIYQTMVYSKMSNDSL